MLISVNFNRIWCVFICYFWGALPVFISFLHSDVILPSIHVDYVNLMWIQAFSILFTSFFQYRYRNWRRSIALRIEFWIILKRRTTQNRPQSTLKSISVRLLFTLKVVCWLYHWTVRSSSGSLSLSRYRLVALTLAHSNNHSMRMFMSKCSTCVRWFLIRNNKQRLKDILTSFVFHYWHPLESACLSFQYQMDSVKPNRKFLMLNHIKANFIWNLKIFFKYMLFVCPCPCGWMQQSNNNNNRAKNIEAIF